MKKTCNRCKALICEGGGCMLGYSNTFDLKKSLIRGYKESYPIEECPKPLTYRELCILAEKKE